jgi:hypothetical protein
MGSKPWAVPDELWERIEPLLRVGGARFAIRAASRSMIGWRCRGSCSSCIRGSVGSISRKSWDLVAG